MAILGLSEEEWQRYRELVVKRRAETLTPQERQELLSISDQIELANVRRIELLIKLAQLRKMPLKTLMESLGIESPVYL
jgi:pantothenate kinase